MKKEELIEEAYDRGEKDARTGVLLSEGSRRYKNDKTLLSAYTKGFIEGLKKGAYV